MSLYGMREIEKRLEAEQRGELARLRAEVERLRAERDGYREDAERVREQRDRMVAAERRHARLPEALIGRIRERLLLSLSWKSAGAWTYSEQEANLLSDILAAIEEGRER